MEYAACNVVYVDRTATEDKLVKKDDLIWPASPSGTQTFAEEVLPNQSHPSPIDTNLQTLLRTFSEGQLQAPHIL